MYWSQDVRDLVITILKADFNDMIATINAERTHTTPDIDDTTNKIGYNWMKNQFPYLLVDIDNSETQTDSLVLDVDFEHLPVVHTVLVMGFLKYANDDIYNYAEDWIEAIGRVLHNYKDCNITWIFQTAVERADIYKNVNETLKSFVVSFEVRIN